MINLLFASPVFASQSVYTALSVLWISVVPIGLGVLLPFGSSSRIVYELR